MATLSERPAVDPPAVECRGLTITYTDEPVVSELDLRLERGETVALLGPSGSGKTTLLYALAGFLAPAAGEIRLCGRLVASPRRSDPPERRPVAMVFQHYGLWPHLDALETVAYPLRRAGLGADAARDEARRLLAQVKIAHLAQRRPAELSGGEQQRVGLARALARRPQVYLLDEPTAHLDTTLKAELQAELATRLRGDGATALHATHDVEEALALADRVVLLRAGRLVQRGTPTEVYAQPSDEWAARLTGPVNLLEGRLARDGQQLLLETSGLTLPVESDVPASMANDPSGKAGLFLVRPDWIDLGGPLRASVEHVAFRGSHTDYGLATPVGQLLLRAPGPPRLARGADASVTVKRCWRLG
jgi:iron(III) transport system ATP-binding protein